MNEVFIVAAKRTPIGTMKGSLSQVESPQLGATVIKSVIDESNIPAGDIDEILMGNVLTADVGQAPARQASMLAGVPLGVGATTINKVCGSAMKAMMIGNDMIKGGSANIIVAGGMESMSNAPHLVRMNNDVIRGSVEMRDHLYRDGLDNPDGRSLGMFSEGTAAEYGITKKMQDDFVIDSTLRAQNAQTKGLFKREITPVVIQTKEGEITVSEDEGPKKIDVATIPELKPSFIENGGTVTSATASEFCDGAAAVMLVSEEELKNRNLKPIAKIIAHATHSQEPEKFITAPIEAIRKVLKKADWKIDDVDLFEINEAVALVPMTAIHDLQIPEEKMNINGGACSLGHPIGASGARIVVALLNALTMKNKKRGIAAICIGGGEGTAIAIELV